MKKELVVPEGLEGPKNATWTFTLSADDGVPMPEKVSYDVEANATVTFGEIKYTEADAGKEYTYTVTESGTVPGVENDATSKKTVTVFITDDGAGTLTVAVDSTEDEPLTFTNTYSAKPVIVDPPVRKIIENNDELYNNGKFTFTIESTSAPEGVEAPMPKNTSIKNTEEYELEDRIEFYEFGEIEFTVPGVYEYTIKESGSVLGVVNDPKAEEGKVITFTVTDDGEGNLVVSPTTDEVEFSFTNTYEVTDIQVS